MPTTLPTTLYALLFADDDYEFFDTEREARDAAVQLFDARHRGCFSGGRFLRGLRLLRRFLGIVIDRLFGLGLGDDSVRIVVLGRRVPGQIGFLLDRLLLGKRGRGR